MLLSELLELLATKHAVGDGRELLRLTPCALQLQQLARERASFGVLVRGHLEREPIDQREP